MYQMCYIANYLGILLVAWQVAKKPGFCQFTLLFPLIHLLFHLQKHITSLALSGAMHSAICNMQGFFLLCVFLFKQLDEITNGRFGCHWNRFNSILPLLWEVPVPRHVVSTLCVYLYVWCVWWVGRFVVVMVSVCLDCLVFDVE